MDRPPVPKSLRFEVFKRDSFTCQYCGAKAPDVVLHIDHIKPVASGGESEFLNLITACAGCNLGKGARPLEDTSVLARQRAQLDELQERREQLDLLMDWKRGLASLKEDAVDRAFAIWSELVPGFQWSTWELGRKHLRSWVARYGLSAVVDAMPVSADQYARRGPDGCFTLESARKAWTMIGGILRVQEEEKRKPYIRDVYYIRGIVRNATGCNNEHLSWLKAEIERAITAGVNTDDLRSAAKTARTVRAFGEQLRNLIDGDCN